jgi:translation initiation factor IF-3
MTDASFTRINTQIRVPQVRLILDDGSSPGIVETWLALKQAKEAGLDLVEINPKSLPIVARIMDYGKFKYEQAKKDKEARKNQKATDTKELSFRPTTDDNDIAHKLAKAREFLAEGHRVRVAMKFRGRELSHMDIGREKLEGIVASLNDLTASNTPFTSEGKQIITILTPKS